MASNMSSNNNVSAAISNNCQPQQVSANFNPSWMQQATPPSRPLASSNNTAQKMAHENEETQPCDPIFAKHSYGREDLLAMMGKINIQAPGGLEKCPFFVEKPQTPIVLLPSTEAEMRLQQNINSSKAMSSFNRTQAHASSNELGSSAGNEVSGGGSWNTINRQGTAPNLTGPRKYNPQHGHGEGGAKQVPSRWSALASGGAPQKPAWKNGPNAGGITSGGSFDRASFRDKTGSVNQQELGEGGRKSQEKSEQPEKVGEKKVAEMVQQQQGKEQNSEPNTTAKGAVGTPFDPPAQQQQPKPTATPPKRPEPVQQSQSIIQPQQQISQPEPIKPAQRVEQWHYMDPTGMQRGPFDSQQMQAWFASGYFTAQLQVRRVGEQTYITLGELFQLNGEQTPFIVKPNQLPKREVSNTAMQQTPQPKIGATTVIGQQRISPSDLLNAAKSASVAGASLGGLVDVERIWATTPEDVSANKNAAMAAFGGGTAGQAGQAPMPGAVTSSASGFAHSAFSQHLKEFELEKALKAREAQIMEEQRKLREKEDLLRRDEQERAEKERRMAEMEAELKRKTEELNRIAHEKNTEFEKRCMQMADYERKKRDELAALEQRILTEQQRQQLRMQEEDRRRATELQEVLRKEHERQRQMQEAEDRRKAEEEQARLRLQMQEAQHMKELAQEQARRAEEEQRRRLIEEQQRQQQRALEAARAERIRQQEVAAKAEAAAKAEQQRMSSNWQSVQQQQPQHQQSHTPTPPNSASVQAQPRSAWQAVAPPQPVPLQFDIPAPVSKPQPHQQSSQAAAERERRGWQQVAMPKPAPIPPVMTKNPGAIGTGVKQQQQAQKQAVGQKSHQQKGQKTAQSAKQTQAQPEDKLTAWICKRLKELNANVDAEVFANFIAQIDSPNEAEDYIIGYLGDKKEVKDFHREFLNKRIELRPRVQQPKKDDLSRPAAALSADSADHAKGGGAPTTTGTSTAKSGPSNGNNHHHQPTAATSAANPFSSSASAAAAKKKKQKQQKVGPPSKFLHSFPLRTSKFEVLDPSTLGFRAVPDPNRVNAGEIDTVQPVVGGQAGSSVGNRKR